MDAHSHLAPTGLLAGIAAIALAAGQARADYSYAYSEQSITGLKITSPIDPNGTVTGLSTSASAAMNGSGLATNSATDTREVYQGAGGPAAENSFLKYSNRSGGTQAGDFNRGDSLLSAAALFAAAGASASNVAESTISAQGLATATGSWSMSGTFTTAANAVTVGYNYANDVVSVVGGGGTAQASFKLTISIQDQFGHEVDATPAELNTALSAPPTGPEIITSGVGSATLSLAGLTAGTTFTINITGTELTAVTFAVPEPASMALAALGLGLAGLVAIRRASPRA